MDDLVKQMQQDAETIPEDILPDSFFSYLKEYERCENENN